VRVDERFEELYAVEFGAVFRAAYLLCGDRSVAEDATQEAFARALERWRRLRDRSWTGGWVMVTALNVTRRAMRRRRPDPTPAAWTGGPQDPDRDVDLWRAVRTLPPRQQEAVALRYVGDLPVADVAAAMQCSQGAVKSHLARARKALREQLEDVRDE
jgi:RNA polymerase sigma factor (sigma-70 family)